jgi:hypothetical protein
MFPPRLLLYCGEDVLRAPVTGRALLAGFFETVQGPRHTEDCRASYPKGNGGKAAGN